MKKTLKTTLALSTLAGLAACGLPGDLRQPPPIFSDPPSEEEQEPISVAAVFTGKEIRDNATYYNSLGGEIPKPAPTIDVEEDSMGEVSPG